MSGRVNVKFVVILSVVLVAVVGAAIFGAYTVVMKSGEDHANLARQAESDGDWAMAERSWGKAVSKERTNVEWLGSYLHAIQVKPTDTPLQYSKQYEKYRAVLRSIAEVQRTDLAAHEMYFEELMLMIRSGPQQREGYDFIISEVNRVEALLFDSADPDLWSHVRRYRGESIASISQIASDVDDELRQIGIEDLQAALLVRPRDAEATNALYIIYTSQANRARLMGRTNEQNAAVTRAHGLVTAFANSNPYSVAAKTMLLRSKIAEGLRDVDKLELFGPAVITARRTMLDRFHGESQEIAELAMETEAGNLDTQTLTTLTQVLATASPSQAQEWLEQVWDAAGHAQPDSRSIQFSYAMFLKQIGRHSDSTAVFQNIADLPDIPVTTEGMLRFSDRQQSLYRMTDIALDKWTQLSSQPAGRDEWLTSAKQYHQKLSELVADDVPMMQYLNARLAKIEDDLPKADRLFREFNTATNFRSVDGLKYAAEVARGLDNPGLERELLEKAHIAGPNDVSIMVGLGHVYMGLRDYERALQLYTRAHDRRPDIESLSNQIDLINSLLDTDSVADPVTRIIAEAQIAQDQGNAAGSLDGLREGFVSHPDNVMIAEVLSNVLVRSELWEEARVVIGQGLALDPDNSRLKSLKIIADIGGDIDQTIEVVRGQDIPELEKQLKLYRLHHQNESPEEASAALDAAERIDPTDAQVIIFRFDEAIREQDAEGARRIYEANKGRDIDGAGGLAIRARVELAEGDRESAKHTLQTAVDRGSMNATTIRLLADVQLQLGETFEALENYEKALSIRPTDLDLLKGYISILARLGRQNDALEIARSAIAIGQQDQQFRELWLGLEGRVGDKQLAYERRLEIAERDPSDERNHAILISLSLDLKDFDGARRQIDEARALKDTLTLASLDARWHADRNDFASAQEVFSAFIASDANDLNDPQAYLVFGQFLINRGAVENGLITIRQARIIQDPENPVADAVLSDELFRLARFGEAIPILESLISADYQADLARNRLIECYIRLDQADLAQSHIDLLNDAEKSSLTMMLMRADVASLREQENVADGLIDATIEAYPNQPVPYMKRAVRLMRHSATMEDAVEDLTRALELNPRNAEAFRFRSMAYFELGQVREAASDTVSSAESDPDNSQLRQGAIKRLLELERPEIASDLVDSGLERHPTDLMLMISSADAFFVTENHRTALRYYELAWEQSKTLAVGERLVSSLLSQANPNVRRARQIAQHPELLDETSPGYYMLRAKIEAEAGDSDSTVLHLSEAYELIKDNPQHVSAWTQKTVNLLESTEAALTFLENLSNLRGLSPWASLFYGQLLLNEEGRKAEGLTVVSRLIDTAQEIALRHVALKLRSMALYDDGEFLAASEDMQLGLELVPNDAELLNNLAYTLALHLNQAEDAELLSRRAVELAPESRAAHDTLGIVYMQLGRSQDALVALERALSLAETEADRATVLVHVGKARLATGDIGGAEEAAQEARSIIAGQSGAESTDREELDELLEQIRNR